MFNSVIQYLYMVTSVGQLELFYHCHFKCPYCSCVYLMVLSPRCDETCSDRTFGDACSFLCSPCFNGSCHHVTGRCVCQSGFQGERWADWKSCTTKCFSLDKFIVSLKATYCFVRCGCSGSILILLFVVELDWPWSICDKWLCKYWNWD